jgi:preprotein translocase subunit YajC
MCEVRKQNSVYTLPQQQEGGSFAPASTLGGNEPQQQSTTSTPNGAGGTTTDLQPDNPLSGMWVLGLMFVVVYLFLIRPERKRQKAQTELRASITKGDKVITSGGIHGAVVALDEAIITLKVDDGTRIKFSRNAVVHITSDKGEAAAEAAPKS